MAHLFLSEAVVHHALRQTLAFLGLESKDVVVDDAIIYFRWRHGLQCGRPVKKIVIRRPKLYGNGGEYYLCHSQWLCHGILHRNGVDVLDLKTGNRLHLTDNQLPRWDAGVLSHGIDLSDRYFVFMWDKPYGAAFSFSHSCLHRLTGNCQTPDGVGFTRITGTGTRIPSGPLVESIVKDKMVVVTNFKGRRLFAHIWDLGADQVGQIGQVCNFAEGNWLHIAADDNVLVGFEINWDVDPPEVQQTKWTLAGQMLERKYVRLSLSSVRGLDITRFPPRRHFSRTFGNITVSRLSSWRDGGDMMDLIYDYAADKLTLRWIDDYLPPFDCEYHRILVTPYVSYEWNSIASENGECISPQYY